MAGQPIDAQVYEVQPVPAVNAHKTNEEVRRKESRVYRVVEQAMLYLAGWCGYLRLN